MTFPALKNHVVFVSGQSLPTVLAVSIPEAQPACVHAIVTPEMRHHSSVLRAVLEGRGRQYKEYFLWDTRQQSVFDLLDKIWGDCGGQSLGLNLTGGTKLMALAAAEWAYACETPVFYIDTATDQIVLPTARQWEYVELPDVLDVESLLAANGYEVEHLTRDAVPADRREILEGMVEMLCGGTQEAAVALRSLNACAQEALRNADRVVKEAARLSPEWEKLIGFCRQAGMLQRGNGWLSFPSEEARAWCNGIWFEEFVRKVLYKLKCDGRIKSWASSVQVRKNSIPNELDALFCVRNRLFTLECKTSFMDDARPDGRNRIVNMLYKADSLHDRLGGVFARPMLCSIFPLQPHARKRADDLHIRVVSGKDMHDLGDILTRWITGA